MSHPPFHLRRSPRLQGYDYAQAGAYFVTICTYQRAALFGEIHDGEMRHNLAGEIAQAEMTCIPAHWNDGVALDFFVVMPNHVHTILVFAGMPFLAPTDKPLSDPADAQKRSPTLGVVIGSYKSGVTRLIREAVNHPNLNVWQGRYHDHVIRNEADLNRIREYVMHNPARWEEDMFFERTS